MYRLLADFVLIVHTTFIAFVVVGLVMIVIGGVLGWRWVRSPFFRVLHVGCILFVVFEAWLDITCPLTTWENGLRRAAGQATYGEQGMIAHYLHAVIFFNPADPRIFIVAYSVFGLLVLATFFLVPVRWRRTKTAA